ncbi:MAG: hypothetical protein QOF01_673 [Thermomicrobiales bacterium]|jgi:hypothetical protein|nr:hypothetical protein [Thermomicrobiales bacterium]
MDQDRFDRIAKLMASDASRRRVLGGVAAAVAGLLGRQPADATGTCHPPCDPKQCTVCKDGHCHSTCDPKKCETCDGYGNCKAACPKGQECDGYGNCKTKCPKGKKICRGKCIPADACCKDDDCKGAGQVCCPDHSPKAGRCIGHGKDGGNRACFHGDFSDD